MSSAASPLWRGIQRDIGKATGAEYKVEHRSAVSGGCINAAWTIEGGGRRYFVKVSDATRATLFEAEAAGLAELRRADAVRVPRPICHSANAKASWIVLEHIELHSRTPHSDAVLGGQLARLHRQTAAAFGWERDNTIGSTPQPNARSSDWPSFFIGGYLRQAERMIEGLLAEIR